MRWSGIVEVGKTKKRHLRSAAFSIWEFLFFVFVGGTKPFKFDDARLVPYLPGDDLPGMFAVVRFDDRPAAMRTIVTAPFEVMEITRGVDLLDDGVTIVGLVW